MRIRRELARDATKFPVLLTKVIYDSSHAGDRLESDDIDELQCELDRAGVRTECGQAGSGRSDPIASSERKTEA